MRDLPMYSAHFLDILCELLQGYRDSCNSIYKGRPCDFKVRSCDLMIMSCDLELGMLSLPLHPAELSLGSVEGLKGVMGGQESVISSKWARDEDINRMIRWVGLLLSMADS